MPENAATRLIELRGKDGERFGCDGRVCRPLQSARCYEVVGKFEFTTGPQVVGKWLTLEVDEYEEVADRPKNCGWSM